MFFNNARLSKKVRARNTVRETEIVPEALDGERIDRVVSTITAESRSWVAARIEAGEILRNGERVTVRSTKVAAGDSVTFPVSEIVDSRPVADSSIPVEVVYHDEHLAVINKAAGVVVHPGSGNTERTLVHGLLAEFPEIAGVGQVERPGIVHRLDKGTSGLLVVARTEAAYLGLVDQMKHHLAARRYRALVAGHVEAETGLIDAPIGRSNRDPSRMTVLPSGREARTKYTMKQRFDLPVAATDVICDLDTGRTHQIRVHLRSIGHPVLGDQQYGNGSALEGLDRPFLHAWKLQFAHPVTGEEVSATADLPDDLQSVLASFQ